MRPTERSNYDYLLVNTTSQKILAQVVFPVSDVHLALSHYTEHLVWLNAMDNKRSAHIHSNAWTNSFAIGYRLSGEPDDLLDIVHQLKGIFDPLDVPASFAIEEREIVLREYDFRIAENVDARASEAMDAFLYDGNQIAASVIGTPKQIKAFTYEAAKELHAQTHVPENAVLVVTGDISKRQLRSALSDTDWPKLAPVADVLQPPLFELKEVSKKLFLYPDNTSAPRLVWRRLVSLSEPVQFDLLEAQTAFLRDILSTNLPGGLAGPLRFDATVARSFDIGLWPIDEENIEIFFQAAPDVGVSLSQMQTTFEATLTQIGTAGIPEETFDRVLDWFDGFWPNWSDPEETAEWMTDYVVDRVSVLREPLNESTLKQIENDLTLRDTNEILQLLSSGGRTTVAFIGPEDRFE